MILALTFAPRVYAQSSDGSPHFAHRMSATIVPDAFPGQLRQAAQAASSEWTTSVEVVGHTAAGVRLVYEAHRLNRQRARDAAAEAVVSKSLDHGDPLNEIRGLFHSCTVGVPPACEVSMRLIEAREMSRVKAPGAAERFAGMRAGPATMEGPNTLRSHQVVSLGFGPKLNGDDFALYDRIEVELRFIPEPQKSSALRRRPMPYKDPWGEILYQGTLLNYEQAKPWRGVSAAPVASKVAQDPALSDRMLKIRVKGEGIYRITGSDMIEAGVEVTDIDPQQLRMYYGGGGVLGLSRRVARGLDRREMAIAVEDGGDGSFDPADFVLFYGEAPERWDYHRGNEEYFWRTNRYTDENLYFLDLGADGEGLRMQERNGSLDVGRPLVVDSYRHRLHLEDNRSLLLQLVGISSGYDWFWEDFDGNARNFSTIIKDTVSDSPVDIRIRFWGWSNATHRFEIFWNEQTLGDVSFTGTSIDTLEVRARNGPAEGLNQLGLFHRDDSPTRLDWIELEYDRRLSAEGGELVFAWPPSAMPGSDDDGVTAEFVLTGFEESKPRIFQVSSQRAAMEVIDFEYDEASGTATLQDWFGGEGIPPKYVAAVPSRWNRPASIELDSPSSLRTADKGADYVIITHPDFRAAADRLASWRAADDRFGPPMRVAVADIEDVYDEFSGGLVDPMAIRSFVKYAYDNWDPQPAFICLMGDGTFDYKNHSGTSHTNWMPPFQDGQSMYDEWYVRVVGEDKLPDLAIGRLPVQTGAEADALVDKLVSYDQAPEIGPWQTRVLLVADDLAHPQKPKEPEAFFLIDAESMAVNFIPDDLDLTKLYLSQFPLEGRTKPKARDEFVRRFNEGALILTYLGHGNPDVLAHEQMFVLSRDAGLIDNDRRLPFMYTAASQVGVFDDPGRQSMPEALLNKPDGGVIGFISATRVGFHLSNMFLAREFHRLMYRANARHVPVGLALTMAKQNVAANAEDRVNIQRYSLLGDPAQRLARPPYTVELTAPDSLRALEEITVAGRIFDVDGRHATDFEGRAWVQAFDSTTRSKVDAITVWRPGATLFRAIVPVSEGSFETAFRVPKDISYKEDKGRISAYVWGKASPSAFGSVSGLVLAGTASNIELDESGPEITIGFVGVASFNDGESVSEKPVLLATLRDASGINITAETGHEMELRVDDLFFTVTDFFTNNTGDYRTGVVEFQLPELEPGTHTISLKAWDSFNNSARAEAEFRVVKTDAGVLSDLLFHPNPMKDRGHFTYSLAAPAASVRIRIFSLAGALVDDIAGTGEAGYNQVDWLPTNLANSAYLYQLAVDLGEGRREKATAAIQVMK